jgi:hypothetical protein
MLVGREGVVNWLRAVKALDFSIYKGASGTITEYKSFGDDLDTAVMEFNQWANLQANWPQPVLFRISAYPNGRPKGKSMTADDGTNPRDVVSTQFYLVSPYSAQAANPYAAMPPGQAAMNGFNNPMGIMGPMPPEALGATNWMGIIQGLKETMNKEWEIRDLKRQLDEERNRKDDANFMDKHKDLVMAGLEMFKPVIAQLTGQATPPARALAGEFRQPEENEPPIPPRTRRRPAPAAPADNTAINAEIDKELKAFLEPHKDPSGDEIPALTRPQLLNMIRGLRFLYGNGLEPEHVAKLMFCAQYQPETWDSLLDQLDAGQINNNENGKEETQA